MIENDKLCVAYAADDQYAKYLGISMLSLFRTNTQFEMIEVFVLDCGITEGNKEKLRFITMEYNRRIYFIPMEEAISGLDLNMGPRKISVASYARLFLATAIPESYSKILYLDCDTIVCDSVSDFWNTRLEGALVAGVRDTVDRLFMKKIRLDPQEYYINAGILLVNLAGWRHRQLVNEFMEFILSFEGNVPHHDQGTINGVCKKEKNIVPPRYNVTSNMISFSAKVIQKMYTMDSYYTQQELEEAIQRPCILHFTTGLFGRPWEENCTHPLRQEYHKVAQASPWRDDPLLPDGRKLSVKLFAMLFRYTPAFFSVTIYRLCSGLFYRKA